MMEDKIIFCDCQKMQISPKPQKIEKTNDTTM